MADLQVASRLHVVRENIATVCAQTGRPEGSVQLIAVSKFIPLPLIVEAWQAGQRIFGESRLPAGLDRQIELSQHLSTLPIDENDIHWHFIGHLQRNKANKATGNFELIHGVDSLLLAEKISSKAVDQGRPQSILLEVNISGEAQKHGLPCDQTLDVACQVGTLPQLELKGLMGMARRDASVTALSESFAGLRTLCEDARRVTGLALPELSMGMSGDYEVAIAEGATTVRVGSAIFGPRTA